MGVRRRASLLAVLAQTTPAQARLRRHSSIPYPLPPLFFILQDRVTMQRTVASSLSALPRLAARRAFSSTPSALDRANAQAKVDTATQSEPRSFPCVETP